MELGNAGLEREADVYPRPCLRGWEESSTIPMGLSSWNSTPTKVFHANFNCQSDGLLAEKEGKIQKSWSAPDMHGYAGGITRAVMAIQLKED